MNAYINMCVLERIYCYPATENQNAEHKFTWSDICVILNAHWTAAHFRLHSRLTRNSHHTIGDFLSAGMVKMAIRQISRFTSPPALTVTTHHCSTWAMCNCSTDNTAQCTSHTLKSLDRHHLHKCSCQSWIFWTCHHEHCSLCYVIAISVVNHC